MEESIITGCKRLASIPDAIAEVIDQAGMSSFKRDFKWDVLDTMRHYRNGYRMAMAVENSN